MALWKVEFDGYWPVGAVAIANALSPEEAGSAVLRALPADLRRKNKVADMTIKEIVVAEGAATILLDGNY